MKATTLASLLVTLSLSGCATSTPIQRLSESRSHFSEEPKLRPHNFPAEDVYRIYHRAATGFVSLDSIREAAEQRALRFAQGQGREVVFLGERTSSPPHILGNFPRIEIVFALGGTSRPAGAESKYDLLEQLKRMLDEGVLTPAEYEIEKAKVLARDK